MKSTDPLFPYQNLFITARPGMGATTLAVNIINKHLDEGKKCLVFAGTHDYSPKYIEQSKENNSRATMKSICNEYCVPIIDNTQLSDIVAHPEFFYDRVHLNENGAKAYTKLFLTQLQAIGLLSF